MYMYYYGKEILSQLLSEREHGAQIQDLGFGNRDPVRDHPGDPLLVVHTWGDVPHVPLSRRGYGPAKAGGPRLLNSPLNLFPFFNYIT